MARVWTFQAPPGVPKHIHLPGPTTNCLTLAPPEVPHGVTMAVERLSTAEMERTWPSKSAEKFTNDMSCRVAGKRANPRAPTTF